MELPRYEDEDNEGKHEDTFIQAKPRAMYLQVWKEIVQILAS